MIKRKKRNWVKKYCKQNYLPWIFANSWSVNDRMSRPYWTELSDICNFVYPHELYKMLMNLNTFTPRKYYYIQQFSASFRSFCIHFGVFYTIFPHFLSFIMFSTANHSAFNAISFGAYVSMFLFYEKIYFKTSLNTKQMLNHFKSVWTIECMDCMRTYMENFKKSIQKMQQNWHVIEDLKWSVHEIFNKYLKNFQKYSKLSHKHATENLINMHLLGVWAIYTNISPGDKGHLE